MAVKQLLIFCKLAAYFTTNDNLLTQNKYYEKTTTYITMLTFNDLGSK